MAIIRCCKDCDDRVIGCHATCERYLGEKKEIEELKEKIKKDQLVDNFILHQQILTTTINLRRYGKKTIE